MLLRKRLFSIAFYGVSFLCIYLAAERFCYKQTDGFTISKITSSLKYQPDWEIAELNQEQKEEVRQILSQKFRYLARGGHLFAFVSEDGKYVLKLFKDHTPLLAKSTPSILKDFLPKRIEKKQKKLQKNFISLKIAFEELREETGLVFVHLNKTKEILPKVTLIDKLQIAHQIDLDSKEFILQKKAEGFLPYMQGLIEKNDMAGMKSAFHAMIDAIILRCQKGIFDEDPYLTNNLGFIGDKAVFIDAGGFVKDSSRKSPSVYMQDIRNMIDKRLKEWIRSKKPEALTILENEILEREEIEMKNVL